MGFKKLSQIPLKPGVYLFKDRKGEVIYVGKARSLRRRVASYFRPNRDLRTSIIVDRMRDIDYIVTASELDALILENDLIKKYSPRYNIALRDDKSYPLIKVTVNEEWPRVMVARRKESDGAHYYGRYQGGMVRAAIRLIKKLFPVRWCAESPLKKREQPCLYYHIGSCSGPCVGRIDNGHYREMIKGVELLLNGKTGKAAEKLKEEMASASSAEDYERAAYLRDRIKLIEKMMEGKSDLAKTPAPRLLSDIEGLRSVLGLEKPPMRIECFDISNIQGTNIVGSMVVFLGGLPLKKDYRRFNVRGLKGKPNDVLAIYEVVKRRYGGSLAAKMDLPDLVMVDGGPAQVSFAGKALEEAKRGTIPLVGLAKREEEIYLPGRGRPLRLDRDSKALLLLQRIRDEAHRFAVTFHREKRGKAMLGQP